MPDQPWPSPEPIERVFADLIAKARSEMDTISGVPHAIRLIPHDPAEVGTERSCNLELFANWILDQR